MKLSHKLKRAALGLSAALTVIAAGAGIAHAADSDGSGAINSTVYRFGRDVSVSGIVNGDVICGGNNVTIDATVNGDVICAGQTVIINGTVNGDVRVAGQNLTLHGKAQRNVSMAGQSITVSGEVGQDAGLAGTDITISGPIGRDVKIKGDDVTISSSVGRNVNSFSGDLTLKQGAQIAGDVTQTGPRPPHKENGAAVSGKVTFNQRQPKQFNFWGFYLAWKIFMVLTLTLLAVIIVALFPGLFRSASVITGRHFWGTLLVGLIAAIVIPVAIFLLSVTVIGLIPALLLGLLWLVAAILSAPLAAYFVGSRAVPTWHPVLAVLVGSLILGVLSLIPFLGELIVVVAYLVGLGTLLWAARTGWQRPDYGEIGTRR